MLSVCAAMAFTIALIPSCCTTICRHLSNTWWAAAACLRLAAEIPVDCRSAQCSKLWPTLSCWQVPKLLPTRGKKAMYDVHLKIVTWGWVHDLASPRENSKVSSSAAAATFCEIHPNIGSHQRQNTVKDSQLYRYIIFYLLILLQRKCFYVSDVHLSKWDLLLCGGIKARREISLANTRKPKVWTFQMHAMGRRKLSPKKEARQVWGDKG